MITVKRKAIKKRAFDLKDKELRQIINIEPKYGTVLLAPYKNRKLKFFPRTPLECVIEHQSDVSDYDNVKIFEGDRVAYRDNAETYVVKMDKEGVFTLNGKTHAIPLREASQFDMTIIGHHLSDSVY